ncbi:hypothetical protein [Clostridium sp. OS1-26]|uniref:hypothetical protein n=1 Tax=Clostridium sp. OS1-26 TaxID=3070681 RepID=UPI0027DF8E2C|nr:hypothetical protein [Clostridium sp. OS1-26]WML34966.1 hypothetical protein RCG18_27630 [Clostridium sp. OS1-26]
MKVIAKSIEMVAWFDKKGVLNPVRFRLDGEVGESITIKIDKVISRDKEKLDGNHMLIFNCQGCVNGAQKLFEIKYELSTCKWILFKI